jgi:hypothetical protein
MLKMTIVYTQTAAKKSTELDLDWVTEAAQVLVGNVMRHMRMDAAERQIFREDMMQEALTQLYDQAIVQQQSSPSLAYVIARTHLIGYVFVNIRGGGRGHQWELSKQYCTYDNLVEADEISDDPAQRGTRLPMKLYRRRPTEEALLAKEAKATAKARWQQFEREIASILAVMRGKQWHPHSLCRAAKALCESVKGTSNHNISRLLGLDQLTTTQIINHYRQYLQAFLALSPLMQGLVRAEGALRLHWWEEVNPQTLNSGQKFIVILPHGAFNVSYYHHKGKGKSYGRLQAGRRIAGKVQIRSVQLGEVGHITPEKLWQGSLTLQEKIAALEAVAA